jgi:hypothetical protein
LTVQLRSLRGASSSGFPPDWPPCAFEGDEGLVFLEVVSRCL